MPSSTARMLRAQVAAPLPVREGLHLSHDALSAGVARGHVRALVAHWADRDRVQDALLLTTELVSNAVLHGWPEVYLTAHVSVHGRLRVEVFDSAPTMPRLRAAWAGGGRGLAIVDSTADEWGVTPDHAGGKTVWFELAGPGGASA